MFCDTDAFVTKFDGDGNVLWTRQAGTSDYDTAFGVATHENGSVYVVGVTYGSLGGPNKGDGDAWVIKFDGDGGLLWRQQFGTREYDFAYRVATTDGKLSVVGGTRGALSGANKGFLDAWVIKFDADGHRLWSRQPGTSADDFAQGVATDMDGNVSVVGGTLGALGGPNKGDADAWVIKYAR
jgi:hypothetical protein